MATFRYQQNYLLTWKIPQQVQQRNAVTQKIDWWCLLAAGATACRQLSRDGKHGNKFLCGNWTKHLLGTAVTTHKLLTAEDRTHSRATVCGNYGRQSVRGRHRLSRSISTAVCPCHLYRQCSTFTCRPSAGRTVTLSHCRARNRLQQVTG